MGNRHTIPLDANRLRLGRDRPLLFAADALSDSVREPERAGAYLRIVRLICVRMALFVRLKIFSRAEAHPVRYPLFSPKKRRNKRGKSVRRRKATRSMGIWKYCLDAPVPKPTGGPYR